MKLELYTKWHEKELVCCCPPKNRCAKEHHCELLEVCINMYEGLSECINGEHAYKRVNGRMHQIR